MNRKKCVICDSENLKDFLKIDKMPIYMGVGDDNRIENSLISEMIFCECLNCYNIQLRKLIDIELIYSHNHNIDTVGELWNNHYYSFLNFVNDGFDNKNILEIGDPSAKIAKLTDCYNKWLIVEKNPAISSSDKIKFIESFFDDNFSIREKVDVIVHSHLFEHIYEPKKFLEKCNIILNDGGDMFFSIPDLRYFLEGDFLPNSILQFEHTYFIDEYYVKYLCSLTGFKFIKKHRYENHSVFFHLKKSDDNQFDDKTNKISDRFLELYNNLKTKINNINSNIKNNKNVFLYGTHVTSQSYIFNGLRTDNIIGLIDSSKSKIGKSLYATDLITYSPNIIKDYNNVIVICSHMGIYKDEISKMLITINPDVILM